MKKRDTILITTGIYPPDAGGPAYYAQSLCDEFTQRGYNVRVAKFSTFKFLPSGLRHLVFFLAILPQVFRADWVVALNTFSVGAPTVLAGLLTGTPVIIRTGGDTVWSMYTHRTGEKILLSDFYTKTRPLSARERFQFTVIRWALRHAAHVVFSTEYQRDIFIPAYRLELKNTSIIENFYPPRKEADKPVIKNFVCIVRNLQWKNIDVLEEAFRIAKHELPDIELEVAYNRPHEEVLARLKTGYAAILVSLGDISPNFILEALMYEKPFILTTETGLKDRLKDVAVWVNPLDSSDIAEKVLWLADDDNYKTQREKLKRFSFVHTYSDIADEFINLVQTL